MAYFGAWGFGVGIMLSPYVFFIPGRPYDALEAALYGSLHRLGFAAAIAGFFVSMTVGQIGTYHTWTPQFSPNLRHARWEWPYQITVIAGGGKWKFSLPKHSPICRDENRVPYECLELLPNQQPQDQQHNNNNNNNKWNKICGLQLPREPHRLSRFLQLTGRWQYDGIMWLALRSVKSNKIDFLNQIRYFSIK